MTRVGIVIAHLGALPEAVLFSAGVVFMTELRHTGDIPPDAALFLVIALHVGVLLGACVTMVTLVAYRWGAINALLVASWVCLVIHSISAVVPWFRQSLHEYVYVASALVGLLSVFLGMIVSLWRTLQRGS